MKRFLFISLTLLFFLGGVWNASGDSNDMALIKEFILSPLSKGLVNGEGYVLDTPLAFKTLTRKENLTGHGHFDWRYDNHFVTLYSEEERYFLEFRVKEYQEFISPDSRGFVLWKFYDYDMDGKFDTVKRDYYLLIQNNIVITPEYPRGFVNASWFYPSKRKSNKRFEEEVNYWLNLVKKGT